MLAQDLVVAMNQCQLIVAARRKVSYFANWGSWISRNRALLQTAFDLCFSRHNDGCLANSMEQEMSEEKDDRLSDEEARRLIKTIEEVEKEEFDELESAKPEKESPKKDEAA